MKLPTWLIGENMECDELETYIVRPGEGALLVAKVTQKRGLKIMLTVAGPGTDDQEAWFETLRQGARFWAAQVMQKEYVRMPPEILVKEGFVPPRFLVCDNARLDRTFIVHTAPPTFLAEVRATIPDLVPQHPRLCSPKGEWLVIPGDFPDGAGPILQEASALLGW